MLDRHDFGFHPLTPICIAVSITALHASFFSGGHHVSGQTWPKSPNVLIIINVSGVYGYLYIDETFDSLICFLWLFLMNKLSHTQNDFYIYYCLSNQILIDVWKWINNFIPHFLMHGINYLCSNWKSSISINGPFMYSGVILRLGYKVWSRWMTFCYVW